MRTWLWTTLALAALTACKKDTPQPAAASASASASASGSASGSASAAPDDGSGAAPSTEDEATPSEKALKAALAGTPLTDAAAAIAADGTHAAICTTGDNGQADAIEVVCHLAQVGKGKAAQTPVLGIDDSATLDGLIDGDKTDPAAVKHIQDKLTAAADVVKKGLGDGARAMKAACELWSASRASPDDPPCKAGDVTITLGDGGKLTAGAIKDTFTIPSGVKNCSYDASGGDVWWDEQTRVALVSIEFTNPSDDCDLVTRYEVHAFKLPPAAAPAPTPTK